MEPSLNEISAPRDPELLPKKWYNILPDLPEQLPPPLKPNGEPVKFDDMAPLFPKELLRQEFSPDTFIDIPEDLRQSYIELGRPTPLIRARNLEKLLKTPAKIFFKYEGVMPAGSHKINTALAQAYYNKLEGTERLTTETGAGQWGSALSLAAALYQIKLRVYMVRVSYEQKPYRRIMMQVYGAEVVPSPSNLTEVGRKILEKDPDNPGSLGIAISEALEDAIKNENTKYSLGSVLNHVLLHQTIIGQEAITQLKEIGIETPDVVIGAVGGGSNFAGLAYPFYKLMKDKSINIEIVAVEPKSVPSMTQGQYRYDFGDTAGLTPLLKMHTLGHKFIPPPIHAGGLRYHGVAPTLSILVRNNVVKPVAYEQNEVFSAAIMFAKTEGIIPAPESAHAVKAAIDIARKAKEENSEKIILFNLSGHGLLDLKGYDDYLNNRLPKSETPKIDLSYLPDM